MANEHFGDHLFPGWLGPDYGGVIVAPVEAFGEIPEIRLAPVLAPVEAFGEIPTVAMAAATFGTVHNTELVSITPQRRVVNF